jgi:hypothetical protein
MLCSNDGSLGSVGNVGLQSECDIVAASKRCGERECVVNPLTELYGLVRVEPDQDSEADTTLPRRPELLGERATL